MSSGQLWILLAGMALVTFVPRYLPFYIADKLRLPSWMERTLEYVPIAILTIIISQTVVFREGKLDLAGTNPYLLTALVACLVAMVQPRLYVTIGVGLLSYGVFKIII